MALQKSIIPKNWLAALEQSHSSFQPVKVKRFTGEND